MAATTYAHFESMISPTTLAHLQSNPERYGHRSYAYAARKESPEAYRAWLNSQPGDDVIVIALKPFFFPTNLTERRLAPVYFNGIYWEICEDAKMLRFLRLELADHPDFTIRELLPKHITLSKLVRQILKGDDLNLTNHEALMYYGDPEDFVTANGILVLEDGNFVLKPSMPEDFQSYHTSVVWQEYTFDRVEVIELLQWFRQVFLDRAVLLSFLDWARNGLFGRTDDVIWYGSGNNSKSCMESLFQTTFDLYFRRFRLAIVNDPSEVQESSSQIFHFKGEWSGDNMNPHFATRTKALAPAFLWLLTRADIHEHLE